MFIFIFLMLNDNTPDFIYFTNCEESRTNVIQEKKKKMDLKHHVSGITNGFNKEIQSQMGHFTSVEGVSRRTLSGEKRQVKQERSCWIRLTNPPFPLLSLIIDSWLC